VLVDGLRHQPAEIHDAAVEHEAPRLDARDVEEVGDQGMDLLPALADVLQDVGRHVGRSRIGVGQELRVPEDDRQRGLDVVRDHREKVRTGLLGGLLRTAVSEDPDQRVGLRHPAERDVPRPARRLDVRPAELAVPAALLGGREHRVEGRGAAREPNEVGGPPADDGRGRRSPRLGKCLVHESDPAGSVDDGRPVGHGAQGECQDIRLPSAEHPRRLTHRAITEQGACRRS